MINKPTAKKLLEKYQKSKDPAKDFLKEELIKIARHLKVPYENDNNKSTLVTLINIGLKNKPSGGEKESPKKSPAKKTTAKKATKSKTKTDNSEKSEEVAEPKETKTSDLDNVEEIIDTLSDDVVEDLPDDADAPVDDVSDDDDDLADADETPSKSKIDLQKVADAVDLYSSQAPAMLTESQLVDYAKSLDPSIEVVASQAVGNPHQITIDLSNGIDKIKIPDLGFYSVDL